jgi:4-hydroxy-2-oxoheptanedioate aldolase
LTDKNPNRARRLSNMRFNRVKRLLKEGKPAIGAHLNLPCTNSAEAMAHAGWDWLAIDAEHGPVTIEKMNDMFIAIGTTDTVPLCRIPANNPVWIKQILDAGAMGIVVPMVCSAEEAANAVKYAKYGPDGVRSAGGGRWRYWHGADYPKYADDEILIIVQIEHIDAVNRTEEILSVPGVDACFIGPNDLAWSMGLGKGPGGKDPSHAAAIAKVLAGAKKVGVPAGIMCRNVEEALMRLEQGFQYIACSSDSVLMFSHASQAVKTLRDKIGK